MNYYELLETEAKKGMYSLIKLLETRKDLIWTKNIEDDNTISIDIETWDNDTYNSEFLMSCEFDEFGEFIDCA